MIHSTSIASQNSTNNSENPIIKAITKFDKIVILGHVRPDGDCIGSSIGLGHIIRTNFKNKTVVVINEHSDYLQFLGESDLPGAVSFGKDVLAIQVDTSNSERSADTEFLDAECIIQIDHHPLVEKFGTIIEHRLISSCSEIIVQLAIENKLTIPKEAAKCLYTGIITDTGRFLYKGVTSQTFQSAAILVDTGFDYHNVALQLTERNIQELHYDAYIYNNIKTTQEGILYLYVTAETMQNLKLTSEETGNAINRIGNIKGYPIWVLFYEIPPKENNKKLSIRVRIRSIGIDISKAAAQFHGGGHANASGALLTSKEEIALLLAELNKLLKI